jgi:formate hydrogenlyase subunit 6/NADH:ubiquinone oxidoreductase subunit I
MRAEEIRVLTPDGELSVGEAAKKYGQPDFDVARDRLRRSLMMKLVPLLPFLQHRPRADKKKCIACGICQEACPVPEKAVHSGNGRKAVYDYKKCIRCYCCQEMCPAKAISAYRPFERKRKKGISR